MSVSEFAIYLDNNPADPEQLAMFGDIKVDQATGMAAEAELHMDIGVDETGIWSGMEEDFAQPFKRIRIEVKIKQGNFVPLIDGPIVAQRFELSGSPNQSKLILVVQDDSVLLNQDEVVTVFEDKSPDEIAQQLFQEFGLTAETDPVNVPAGGLTRYLVQRGSAMQFLKELARRHGMFIYIEPDESVGSSVGYFKKPDLSSSDYPELLLMGAERNINQFSAQFDGLRPLKARADNVDITDQTIVSSETDSSDLEIQGDETAHDLVTVGQTILARTREATTDLDAATLAAVNHSSWAYSANAQVSADAYEAVLLPYRVITVVGAGGYLSGDWLISQVTHTINETGYEQAFNLRRNARTEGVGGSSSVLGGVF